MVAVAHREEADFRAVQELFDDDLGAGRAEAARAQRVVDRRMGLGNGRRDRYPLAAGEPVGLDHHRRTLLPDKRLCLGGIAEPAVAGGRDALAGAQILHKALGAFERGGCLARAEGRDPRAFERIDEAGDERRLRADDDKIDCRLPAEGDQPRRVAGRDRHAFRLLGDPGIARRAIDLVDQGRGGDRPAQRVLAPARPDHQDIHSEVPTRCRRASRCCVTSAAISVAG